MAERSNSHIRYGLIRKWEAYRDSIKNIPLQTRAEKRREARLLARVFALITLICGMLITFVLPPFCAPDEHIHFVNVYDMSRGNLLAQEFDGKLVRWIPAYYDSYIKEYPVSLTGVDNPNRFSALDLYNSTSNSWHLVDDTPTPFVTDITSSGYLISAISMAAGTMIGELLHFDNVVFPYNQMIMGRIGNLFFYVLVIWFAIRRAPHFNKTITLIGLMPMSLFLGASLSYDAVLIPVSLYFFAMVLDLHVEPEKQISSRDVLKVMLCVLMMTGMKSGAYIPLLALLLTVPRTKYGSMKRMLLCIGGVALMVMIGYLPTLILNRTKAGMEAYSEINTVALSQQEWLKSHLGSLPGILGNTIYKCGVLWLYGFWGLLGWTDTFFPIPIMLLGIVLTGVMALAEAGSFTLWEGKRWKNLLALLGAMISAVGIMLGMYLYYTSIYGEGIGASWIEGVQGRYFIPLFMGLVLAISNPVLLKIPAFRNGTADRRLTQGTMLWGAACGAMTVIILRMKFWI